MVDSGFFLPVGSVSFLPVSAGLPNSHRVENSFKNRKAGSWEQGDWQGDGKQLFNFESVPLAVEGDFLNILFSLSPASSRFLLKGPSPVKHLNTHPS